VSWDARGAANFHHFKTFHLQDQLGMQQNIFNIKALVRRAIFTSNTVKPVYNDHPRDPKFVVVVDRWSLFRGRFMLWSLKLGIQNGGRCRQVVAIQRWSLTQVWLYCDKTIIVSSSCELKISIHGYLSWFWKAKAIFCQKNIAFVKK
jgi:hypothetical protein